MRKAKPVIFSYRLLGKLFILTALVAFASKGRAGGWVSSGGDGVVCFENREYAQKIEQELIENRRLPDDFDWTQVEYVRSLERFERLDFLFEQIAKETDYKKIVSEKLDLLHEMSPLFHTYFQMIQPVLEESSWISHDSVAEIDDSVDRSHVHRQAPRCVLVQLFERRALSVDGQTPKIEIHYNRPMWNRLDPVDKALLYFHEGLYLIGREVGSYGNAHSHSNDLRDLVRLIMDDEFEAFWGEFSMPSAPDQDRAFSEVSKASMQALRARLNQLYGDYVLLFFDEFKINLPPESGALTQANRTHAFLDFFFYARRDMDACLKRADLHNVDPKLLEAGVTLEEAIRNKCKFLVMHSFRINLYLDSLKEEQAQVAAFVYLINNVLDVSEHLVLGEQLFYWSPTYVEGNPSERSYLSYTCRLLDEVFDLESFENQDDAAVLKRARAYCDRVRESRIN